MKHLTIKQRYTISTMLEKGFTHKEIGETNGKDKSVVSRKIEQKQNQRSCQYLYKK